MALNLTALNASLGAYFREQDPLLMQRIGLGMESVKHCRIVNVKDELPLISPTGPALVRPQLHDNAWNPTANAVGFTPRILKARAGKADLAIVPAQLWNTYLGVQAKRGSSDQHFLPFEQFIYEYILGRVVEDVETNVPFKGVYNAAGTGPVDVADGFLKIIADEITATNIPAGQIFTSGAITSSNAYDSVWGTYKIVTPALLNKPLKAFMSFDTFFKYMEDYSAQFTAAPYNTSFEKTMLHGTQVELVPLAAMGTSSRIIITPADNMVVGFDLESDLQQIKSETNRRGIDVMIDFRMGQQIADLRYVFVNNQA